VREEFLVIASNACSGPFPLWVWCGGPRERACARR